jgi:hypothetical protein
MQTGYKARKEAEKVSYPWDNLLSQFTTSILASEAKARWDKSHQPKPRKACAAWPLNHASAGASPAS